MPIIRLIPSTCADAILGRLENNDCVTFTQFSNLIPAPDNPAQLVPRPAAIKYSNSDRAVTTTAMSIYGNYIFGWMNDPAASGTDIPYIFDILNNAYLTITGITTSGSTRNTPMSTVAGAWIPPHAEMIGSSVILTHFGFDGTGTAPARYFGVLTAPGNPVQGLVNKPSHAVVTQTDGYDWSISLSKAYPTGGTFTLTMTDWAGNTYTTAAIAYNATAAAAANALNTAYGLTGLGGNAFIAWSGGPLPGNPVSVQCWQATPPYYPFYAPGISSLVPGSASTTGGGTMVPGWVTSGNWQYTCMNTSTNPLPSAPVWAAEYQSRCYYFCNPSGTTLPGVLISDNLGSGGPASRSSAVAGVIFTFGDNIPLICGKRLSLTTLTGSITSALYVFKQANMGRPNIYQITGDPATNNVDMQALNTNVSTTSPNSLCSSPKGLFFVAPDGGRYVDYNGQVNPPIGFSGTGITVPFIYSLNPSQVAADSNGDIILIGTQNASIPGAPFQIWCADITRGIWHGPHTFPVGLVQAWGQNFIATPPAGQGTGFYLLSFVPSTQDAFVESGNPMTCIYQTGLFPDRRELMLITCHKHFAQLGFNGGNTFNIAVTDGAGATIETVTLQTAGRQLLGRFEIPWSQPMTSDYFALTMTVPAVLGLRIGIYEIDYAETGQSVRPSQ